jgi:hypothetical protein
MASRDAAALNVNKFLIGLSSFTVLLRQQPYGIHTKSIPCEVRTRFKAFIAIDSRRAAMARTKSVLGDVRRDERAEWMLERIVASGSLVLRALGGTRSGEMAAHRLLSSDDVDPTTLLTPMSREQLRRAMAAGLWRCRIRRRSISIGTVVQLPVLVRPVTTKYGLFRSSRRGRGRRRRSAAWRGGSTDLDAR